MSKAFPYQLVGFLDKVPEIGEPVYSGKNGWYPQIALKRRFNVNGQTEDQIIELTRAFCQTQKTFVIAIGQETRTDKMPVNVLEVEPTEELMQFHKDFIAALGSDLESRFPEREDGYYPHITSEYNGKQVVNVDLYSDRTFTLNEVWLIRDEENENSVALAKFPLNA